MTVNEALLYSKIRERLKKRRAELDLTQAELAQLAKLQRTSIANVEAGHQRPPLHMLYTLCDVMDLEVTDLLPSLEEVEVTAPARAVFNGDIENMRRSSPMTAEFVAQILGNKEAQPLG